MKWHETYDLLINTDFTLISQETSNVSAILLV
jgi:hypothetical protein